MPLAVGVDRGSRLLKVVVLQGKGKKLMVHDASIHSVADGALSDEETGAECVKTIQKKINAHFNRIGTALSGSAVFVKTISLPVMTERDIRDHLTLEIDRYIGLDAQDVLWDVYHPEIFTEGKNDQQEQFLVVAKKESVKNQLESFRRCGMAVQFVDVDIFALINVVTFNFGKEGRWLLAHMGPTGMTLVVIAQGEPVSTRKVSYEAEWYGDLLDQILPFRDSLEVKNDLGTSETVLLERFLEETRDQILGSVESFSDQSEGVIDRGILLSGGYACVPEMATILASSLAMSVHLLDPFQSIIVPPAIQKDPVFQQMRPLLGVAVGVALRGAQSDD